MKYDVIIIGARPEGIFTEVELNRKNAGKQILMNDKG